MVVEFLRMGGKRFNSKWMEPFSNSTEAKYWYVRVPKRGCHDSSGIFGKKKPETSLVFPGNVAANVKLDTKNHIFMKGTSKYCHCKHCDDRSLYLCQKCNAVLHPDCFKEYHSWNTNFIVLFPTGSANNVNPVTIFRKI